MWFCFNDGFVSAVQDRNNVNRLVVRARRLQDIENIFPDKNIIVGGSTDYNYRVFVDKTEFAEMVMDRISNINYDNFKNSTHEPDLHNLYGNFWSLHYRYQLKENTD
jgi:hypothetical protein